ncbi:MAG: hypothetical protein M3332_02600 [Actinomycetota bacterium]|nr:hypothetical protein [Actinomycetota bacterium]
MFHHREDRIRADIQLCWLALLLLRVIENATGDTWRNTHHELDRLALVTLATPNGRVAALAAHPRGTGPSSLRWTCPNHPGSTASLCRAATDPANRAGQPV